MHLSDRVLVLESDPGRLAASIDVALPHPRPRDDAAGAQAIAAVRQALHAAHAL